MRKRKLKGDGPRVHVWWCALGCRAEIVSATRPRCCGRRMADLGWRAGERPAVYVYYSTPGEAA